MPCIQTGTGICHVYVDKAADLEMAVDIVENAKTSRPSVSATPRKRCWFTRTLQRSFADAKDPPGRRPGRRF